MGRAFRDVEGAVPYGVCGGNTNINYGSDVKVKKYKFIIAGSGWRSLYYVRAAKALPEVFELCAMYCRTPEKAEKMSREHGIRATNSIEECLGYELDFVVVAVGKNSIAEVSLEWARRGLAVLCETPAALDVESLNRLWKAHEEGCRIVVAEQFTRFPEYAALIRLVRRRLIGEPDFLNISLAHDYHGASLMRALLDVSPDVGFTVRGRAYKFPTVETFTRYERYYDGRTADKKRTVAVFEFENGKTALFDFDSEQYRSPIRNNSVKIRGCRGEIADRTVCYLNEKFEDIKSEIDVKTRIVQTGDPNPSLSIVEEVTDISFEGESVYAPKFGLRDLAQDETAVAELMAGAAEYARGNAPEPYPLKDALQDAYMSILLHRAVESGETIKSEKQIWNK